MSELSPEPAELPAGLTPAAIRERAEFLRRVEIQEERSRSIALTVLVWGPSPDQETPVGKKRREIRDALIEAGHNAMFSEEIDAAGSHHSEASREFFQATSAHLVVVLIEDAPGALAEVCDFASHPDLVAKFLVLAPDKYKEGYVAKGTLKDIANAQGAVSWYEAGDLVACRVLGTAMRRVEALRQLRFRHQLREQ